MFGRCSSCSPVASAVARAYPDSSAALRGLPCSAKRLANSACRGSSVFSGDTAVSILQVCPVFLAGATFWLACRALYRHGHGAMFQSRAQNIPQTIEPTYTRQCPNAVHKHRMFHGCFGEKRRCERRGQLFTLRSHHAVLVQPSNHVARAWTTKVPVSVSSVQVRPAVQLFPTRYIFFSCVAYFWLYRSLSLHKSTL
jgi:hypothetical protein